jgi:hypothetical protein
MEILLFTWPGLTQPKLIQLGGAFVLKMKALYVLPFIVIGIVHAQWGLEEEIRERGYTTSTSTVKPLTTSQIPLTTTLPTTTTTPRPYHDVCPEYDYPSVYRGSCCDCEHYNYDFVFNISAQDDNVPPFHHAHPCH